MLQSNGAVVVAKANLRCLWALLTLLKISGCPGGVQAKAHGINIGFVVVVNTAEVYF